MAGALVRPLKPVHERMVLLHFMGQSNVEIAALTGYTDVQVGNILKDPKSQEIIEELKERLKRNVIGSIENNILRAAELAGERILETMEVEVPNRIASVAFTKHQDTVGLELLKQLGYVGEKKSEDGARGLAVPVDHVDRLARAIEISEADYTIVEEDVNP